MFSEGVRSVTFRHGSSALRKITKRERKKKRNRKTSQQRTPLWSSRYEGLSVLTPSALREGAETDGCRKVLPGPECKIQ